MLDMGAKGEAQFSASARIAGGVVMRLFDTHDYQERIGKGMAEAIIQYLGELDEVLVDVPKERARAKKVSGYAEVQESLRKYSYQKDLMAQKQPADHIWLWRGICRFVEVKSTSNPLGFPATNLKEQQLNYALDVLVEDGHHYYFIVCYPGYPTEKRTPWAYWVHSGFIDDLWHQRGGYGLIRWPEIEKVGIRIPYWAGNKAEEMGCHWDLSGIEAQSLLPEGP
jgi:penicillin-binding protein-related factor A (putative recombinase)